MKLTNHRLVLIGLLCSSVICQDCVTFDFENDFNSSFSNEIGVCRGMVMWNIGSYKNLPIDGPDTSSSKFVYPNENLSCASSFTFEMTGNGVLEVNMFMKPKSANDQVTILAKQIIKSGPEVVVGYSWIFASDDNFFSGWRTVRFPVSGLGTFSGYITILGIAARDSIVLIDSFRFIAPTFDEDLCLIYEEDKTTTASSINTSTNTIAPTTVTVGPTATQPTTDDYATTACQATTTEHSSTTNGVASSDTPAVTEELSTTNELTSSNSPTTIEDGTDEPTAKTNMTTTGILTTVPVSSTTETITTSSSPIITTSTERPRLSISIMLIKIKKFFR